MRAFNQQGKHSARAWLYDQTNFIALKEMSCIVSTDHVNKQEGFSYVANKRTVLPTEASVGCGRFCRLRFAASNGGCRHWRDVRILDCQPGMCRCSAVISSKVGSSEAAEALRITKSCGTKKNG